jgi:hypothetical protein
MEQNMPSHDYVLSLYEVCEVLSKSSRTISRYVHRNILHPVGVKSRQGTLEYRFSRAEVDELKRRELERLSFPRLGDMMPGMASFASMDYQASPTMPRTRFTIPGIAYPTAPAVNNSNVAADSQSPPPVQSDPDVEIAANPTNPNAFSSFSPDTAVNHANTPDIAVAPASDNQPIIKLLKETTEMLRDQLRVKDNQIKDLDEKIGQLIERNRETNILLKGLQDKMVLLEKPKSENKENRPQQAAKVEEVAPSAAPAPAAGYNPAPAIKVRVAYSDSVPAVENPDPENNADDDGRDWPNVPSKNDRDAGHGFFGKIFRQ